MPFTPTPLKTNPVELALTIREMRMKQQQAERQFQIDKINAIQSAKSAQAEEQRKDQKHRLDYAKGLQEYQTKQREVMAGIDENVQTAQPRFEAGIDAIAPSNDLLNSPAGFTEIVQDLAPGTFDPDVKQIEGVREGTFGPIDARINQLARAEAAITGESVDAVAARLRTSAGLQGETNRRLAGEERKQALETRRKEKQQDFVFSQKEKAADERRRLAAEERARETGRWEKNDLIQEKVRLEKKFEDARKTNEDWNALDKLKTEDKAINYLEIVQRWVRNVDEGATVREGDIDLVRAFGMSGIDELKAWLAGTTDAEDKIAAVSKDSIKTAFQQILEERDRSWADAWGSANDYAEAVEWNERERRTALPQSRAMRRVLERHMKNTVPATPVPDTFKTDSNMRLANERAARRLHIPPSRVSPTEGILELRRMYQEAAGGSR